MILYLLPPRRPLTAAQQALDLALISRTAAISLYLRQKQEKKK